MKCDVLRRRRRDDDAAGARAATSDDDATDATGRQAPQPEVQLLPSGRRSVCVCLFECLMFSLIFILLQMGATLCGPGFDRLWVLNVFVTLISESRQLHKRLFLCLVRGFGMVL